MKKLGLHELRKEYLDFFESKGHLKEKSFSLIPKNDKSLLLIGAGMAPLKKFFTGELKAPKNRMTTCQKCIRTGDIDSVGKTDRHGTFFEMLGNFSFGDYFKKEAIAWAYEFLTQNLNIASEKLWVTVYKDDEDAYSLWKEIGIKEEQIIKLGKEDNFWELEVGPSGPCTEIFYDRGEKYGELLDFEQASRSERLIELWNLVFTQFDKQKNGEYIPLPHPNIDTGMGLERMTAVMEGVHSIFDISAMREIINKIEEISDKKYKENEKYDISIRIIADHVRAMTFMVSDGIIPSNEGRGYVLRKIIRRALRHGKLLGIESAFLSEIVNIVIDSWKSFYQELNANRETIIKIIEAEERKFEETIKEGISLLNNFVQEMKENNEKVLSGEKAFKLYDTYGFPLDLTLEILNEDGYSVDKEKFDENMNIQRQRARQSLDNSDSGWKKGKDESIYEGFFNDFLGYKYDVCEGSLVKLIIDQDNNVVDTSSKGEKVTIILDKTPFYGESGGQIGDIGYLQGESSKLRVLNTHKTKSQLMLHECEVEEGSIKVGDLISACIDSVRRNDIRKNHTATHLLHKALKIVLGEHVNQAGSYVSEDRLRFDFTHYEAMTEKQLKEVERIVNDVIFKQIPVNIELMTLEQSKKEGVVGLFEDKYGDEVRVVKVGTFSMELCGGTHVNNTQDIAMFKILQESGIAAGIRRIEAITGRYVYEYLLDDENIIQNICEQTKSLKDQLSLKVESIIKSDKEKDRQIKKMKEDLSNTKTSDIFENIEEYMGYKLFVATLENVEISDLRNISDKAKDKMKSGFVVLSTENEGKVGLIVALTKDLLDKGYNAGKIIREIAPIINGKGGGRPDMAQAGGDTCVSSEVLKQKTQEVLKSIIK